jgi:hypothetical protein
MDDFNRPDDNDFDLPESGIMNDASDPQAYRLLHQDNFRPSKVLTQSSQASIFIGNLKNYDYIVQSDRHYVVGKKVVLK